MPGARGLLSNRDLPLSGTCFRRQCSTARTLSSVGVNPLQCGGSDGYSGITANPALGAAVDLLVGHGGTAILAEAPEIYGAEHLLTRRAADVKIGNDLIQLVWRKNYTKRNGAQLNSNPSRGNKAGGLSTILEKSLGAVAKGGQSPYRQFIATRRSRRRASSSWIRREVRSGLGDRAGGRRRQSAGFHNWPGYAYGCKPTPSIKLASTPMFERMREDMDINCGDVLDDASIEQKGLEIFQKMLAVASCKQSKSELIGYGDPEFVPWQIGAIL